MQKKTNSGVNTKRVCVCGRTIWKNSKYPLCANCMKDVHVRFRYLKAYYGEEYFIQWLEKEEDYGVGKCAICGNNYTFMGNNPFPIVNDEDSRCCAICDGTVVLDARIDLVVSLLDSGELSPTMEACNS